MACESSFVMTPYVLGGKTPGEVVTINVTGITQSNVDALSGLYPTYDCAAILALINQLSDLGMWGFAKDGLEAGWSPGLVINRNDIVWNLFDNTAPRTFDGSYSGIFNGNDVGSFPITFTWDGTGITSVDWHGAPATFTFGPGQWTSMQFRGVYGGILFPESIYPTLPLPTTYRAINDVNSLLGCVAPACAAPVVVTTNIEFQYGTKFANFTKFVNPFGFGQ